MSSWTHRKRAGSEDRREVEDFNALPTVRVDDEEMQALHTPRSFIAAGTRRSTPRTTTVTRAVGARHGVSPVP